MLNLFSSIEKGVTKIAQGIFDRLQVIQSSRFLALWQVTIKYCE